MNNDTKGLHKGEEKGDRQQVAVVIGSSSGIEYETSLSLARNGFYVFAIMRKLDDDINHNMCVYIFIHILQSLFWAFLD
jgi:short-subunit dehydrogenase